MPVFGAFHSVFGIVENGSHYYLLLPLGKSRYGQTGRIDGACIIVVPLHHPADWEIYSHLFFNITFVFSSVELL